TLVGVAPNHIGGQRTAHQLSFPVSRRHCDDEPAHLAGLHFLKRLRQKAMKYLVFIARRLRIINVLRVGQNHLVEEDQVVSRAARAQHPLHVEQRGLRCSGGRVDLLWRRCGHYNRALNHSMKKAKTVLTTSEMTPIMPSDRWYAVSCL